MEEIVRFMNFHEWITERNFDEIWETHECNIIGLDIHEHDGFNGDLWNNLRIRQIRVQMHLDLGTYGEKFKRIQPSCPFRSKHPSCEYG
ncbi:hypothetical protein CsSME_00029399 [Camellia sinensis var. sinensis]